MSNQKCKPSDGDDLQVTGSNQVVDSRDACATLCDANLACDLFNFI